LIFAFELFECAPLKVFDPCPFFRLLPTLSAGPTSENISMFLLEELFLDTPQRGTITLSDKKLKKTTHLLSNGWVFCVFPILQTEA